MTHVHEREFLVEKQDVRQVLLIDGDAPARVALARQIARYEVYEVLEADSASQALELATQHRCDAFLVDVQLSDMSGRELCGLLRRRSLTAPIILLGDDLEDSDIILGLDAGANDVVSKSGRLGVLLARLRAHLRQFERSDDAVLPIGPYLFHVARRELVETKSGRKVRLTTKEAAILKLLYQNRGKTLFRGKIVREVWGMRTDLETHTTETHIYRIRRKIEPDPSDPRIILSTPGGGYRMAEDWLAPPPSNVHWRFAQRASSVTA
jgi:DNA-binding response OmpR family regulator